MTRTTLGRYVNERRTALGLRAEDVGAAIGKSQSWVSRLETGAQKVFPEPQEIHALAAVDAELATLTEIPKPAELAPAFARVRELAAALPLLGDDARRRLLLALGRIRWDGSVRIVYAPEYRPLIPQPTVITPRYRPGVDEWEVEIDAAI